MVRVLVRAQESGGVGDGEDEVVTLNCVYLVLGLNKDHEPLYLEILLFFFSVSL